MKYMVVYDTSYGNTTRVAEAIRAGLGADAEAHEIETLHPGDLSKLDLLVVGSPTQAGRPTQSMEEWLRTLPPAPEGGQVAVFDTRIGSHDVAAPVRLLVNVIGYAAPRIAKVLAAKGYTLVGEPHGFFVTGKEGPLADGEIEHARAWGEDLARQYAKPSVSVA
jgi:flavodoxin